MDLNHSDDIYAQTKKPYKVVLESVTQTKKKLNTIVTYNEDPPPGYTFVPVGVRDLTDYCKELSRQRGLQVQIVSENPKTKRAKNADNLSHHVHRIGHHFDNKVVEQACDWRGYKTSRRPGRTIMNVVAPLNIERRLESHGKRMGLTTNEGSEEQRTRQVRETIKELFPKIPNFDLEAIVARAFERGAKTVGNADLPLSRRVQLAVVAHIRHNYTQYDNFLRQTTWLQARSLVEQATLDRVVEWRGEDDHGALELEDIFREVIVLDEDESDFDRSDEAGRSREPSVEYLSTRSIIKDMRHLEMTNDESRITRVSTIPEIIHVRPQRRILSKRILNHEELSRRYDETKARNIHRRHENLAEGHIENGYFPQGYEGSSSGAVYIEDVPHSRRDYDRDPQRQKENIDGQGSITTGQTDRVAHRNRTFATGVESYRDLPLDMQHPLPRPQQAISSSAARPMYAFEPQNPYQGTSFDRHPRRTPELVSRLSNIAQSIEVDSLLPTNHVSNRMKRKSESELISTHHGFDHIPIDESPRKRIKAESYILTSREQGMPMDRLSSNMTSTAFDHRSRKPEIIDLTVSPQARRTMNQLVDSNRIERLNDTPETLEEPIANFRRADNAYYPRKHNLPSSTEASSQFVRTYSHGEHHDNSEVYVLPRSTQPYIMSNLRGRNGLDHPQRRSDAYAVGFHSAERHDGSDHWAPRNLETSQTSSLARDLSGTRPPILLRPRSLSPPPRSTLNRPVSYLYPK